MNVSVLTKDSDDVDGMYSNTLSQLEVIIWDLKREMLRGISKIIDEDYDELCKKYCPVSRLIQSTGTMIVPGIQPIQETLEESVYVKPEDPVPAPAPAQNHPQPRSVKSTKKSSRSRLDKVWDPETQCHCRRHIGFCHSLIKHIEDGRQLCKRHYHIYLEYKERKNTDTNEWFGVVDEKPDITNTNPKVLTKWRDGKYANGKKIQGDRYIYEGREMNVNLFHYRKYAALYTNITGVESGSGSGEKIAGFLNIYTNEFITLPVHMWDISRSMEEQRDPVEISKERDYPIYSLDS